MKKPVHAERTETINTRPEILYGILRDYAHGHPKILPREHFTSVSVLKGGQGTGTVVKLTMRAFGSEVTNVMTVTEPEPGRLIVERDDDAGVVTSFSLTPIEGSSKTSLRIATEWKAKPGIKGFIEGVLTPCVARMMYKKEFRKIAEYVVRS